MSKSSIKMMARRIKRAFAAHHEARLELNRLISVGRKNGWPMPWEPGFKDENQGSAT